MRPNSDPYFAIVFVIIIVATIGVSAVMKVDRGTHVPMQAPPANGLSN